MADITTSPPTGSPSGVYYSNFDAGVFQDPEANTQNTAAAAQQWLAQNPDASAQDIINWGYANGGNTYAGADEFLQQFGIDIDKLVANRQASASDIIGGAQPLPQGVQGQAQTSDGSTAGGVQASSQMQAPAANSRQVANGTSADSPVDSPVDSQADASADSPVDSQADASADSPVESQGEAGATPANGSYTVKPGDTLWDIAAANGISLQSLIEANPQISNPDLIYPGQNVNIPGGGSAGGPDQGSPATPGSPDPAANPAGGTQITLPNGGGTVNAPNATAAAAVNKALQQLGTPYVYGAADPNKGFDCSGLTSWAYGKAGVNLPRHSGDQTIGQKVSQQDLAPGDLVVWQGHVAMYVGDGQMIEAPVPGKDVCLSPLRTSNNGDAFLGFYRPTVA